MTMPEVVASHMYSVLWIPTNRDGRKLQLLVTVWYLPS